jgi:hypothetical protein
MKFNFSKLVLFQTLLCIGCQYMENAEIKKQIQEFLNKGVIMPSTSPCGSPIVLVPKKDGTWCMCVDFRALSNITVKNRYPLPRIDDFLDQLKDAKYFTKLDLRSGYHQISIAEGDTWKTTFKTKQGLFEWMVMPFGLCNAPATFMRVMNDVLRPFLDDCVIVYLDDILIFSKSREEHVKHVKQVFQWGGKQQKDFDTLKEKISSAPVLALLNLRQPFEIQTDARNYAMGAVLLQHGKPIFFHSGTFNGVVINYPTYDKELYALVQSVKKWKHYLLGKETIVHTDH